MNGQSHGTHSLVEAIQECGPIGCCSIDEYNADIIAEATIKYLRDRVSKQDARLAGLDKVPMSEPKQLNVSQWGRTSVLNDEQCLEIFNAMLDVVVVSEMIGQAKPMSARLHPSNPHGKGEYE